MKHTKGKWRAVNFIHKMDTGMFRNSIAVYIGNTKNGVLAANAYGKSLEEAEANAKLISKAPEMYEALKEISEAKGTYALDRMTHAENTIRDMVSIAKSILKEIES